MAFQFSGTKSISSLSLVAVLLMVFGLGLTVVSTQQQQDNRSEAAFSRPSVPSYIITEKSSQVSIGPCYATSGDRAGAMCKSDGGTQYSYVSESQALQHCPGGFVYSNVRNGGNTIPSSAWYCPGGNEYRCCKNYQPSDVTASAEPATITLPTSKVTLKGSAIDKDAEGWRNYLTYKWTKVSGPNSPDLGDEETSATQEVDGLVQGTYVFRMTVTDGYAPKTKDVTVTVNAPDNKPPTANAGTNQEITLPTNSVTLSGTGSDPEGGDLVYFWQKKSGPGAFAITDDHKATTTVTGLVEGTYVFTLNVTDDKDVAAADDVQVIVKPAGITTFSLDLFLHGIGKGGDNKNPYNEGDPLGTNPPAHLKRAVVVDVYDLDENLIVTKQGEVEYNSESGSYKGDVIMGTTLTNGAHIIKVKLSHSLRGQISRNITAGTTNVIPVMKLVNGDADNDAKLDILDYNIIFECVEDLDFNQPPINCPSAEKRVQADIDDDGKTHIFDLNLFLRGGR